MAKRSEVETVSLRVAGPGRYKVLAALEGSDPVTRVAITGNDATVTVEGGTKPLRLGGEAGPGSNKAAVMYLLSGPKRTVKRYDDVMRHVETLLETEGPDAVMQRLTKETHQAAQAMSVVEGVARSERDNVLSPPPSPPTEAARRWAERKVAMLRENDHATGPELGRLTGSRAKNLAERASSWRREGRVFAVNDGSRDVYPLFQIKGDKPHPVVAEVLKRLRPKLSDWEVFAWFTAPDTWTCEGRPPKDLLDSDPDSVLEAARHTVAESWD